MPTHFFLPELCGGDGWSSAAEPATTSPSRPLGLFALHSLYLENGSSCFPPALLRICLEYVRETHSHRGFKEMGVFFSGRQPAHGSTVRLAVDFSSAMSKLTRWPKMAAILFLSPMIFQPVKDKEKMPLPGKESCTYTSL